MKKRTRLMACRSILKNARSQEFSAALGTALVDSEGRQYIADNTHAVRLDKPLGRLESVSLADTLKDSPQNLLASHLARMFADIDNNFNSIEWFDMPDRENVLRMIEAAKAGGFKPYLPYGSSGFGVDLNYLLDMIDIFPTAREFGWIYLGSHPCAYTRVAGEGEAFILPVRVAGDEKKGA